MRQSGLAAVRASKGVDVGMPAAILNIVVI
jgi:hypothetical protein